MKAPFLDTNVLLRHFLQDEPRQSPRATAYLTKIEQDGTQVRISDIVIFETVFTLQRTYRQPKTLIREKLLPLLQLPEIVLPGKRKYRKIFDLYADLNVSFADAYHVVMMQKLKINKVISFDHEFDRVAGIKRIEP